MLSDFQLLGIEETSDKALIKSAYRKRMKELHPDLSKGDRTFEKHSLLVSVNQAYRRLLERDEEKANAAAAAEPRRPKARDELVAHSDPAYVYYKTALGCYGKIHPSAWDLEKSGMLNIKISEDDSEQELMRKKIMELVKLFPKAYYYLSIVVHEYPESIWVADAREKMTQIEKMTRRYKKIIESFSDWNTDRKVHIKKYMDQYVKHKNTRKRMEDAGIEKRWKS